MEYDENGYPKYDVNNQMAKVYVIWAEAWVLFSFEGNKSPDRTMLGICGYSGRIFKVTSPENVITVSVVHDIFINDRTKDGGCEEGTRCLDFSCPKNRTTWETFRNAHNIKSKKAPLGFGKPIWFNVNSDGELLSFRAYFEKYPNGILLAKELGAEEATYDDDNKMVNEKPGRISLKPGIRFNIFKRDHYRCQICGRTAQDGAILEVDHKHPVILGGKDDIENLWVLCFECNRGKGMKTL